MDCWSIAIHPIFTYLSLDLGRWGVEKAWILIDLVKDPNPKGILSLSVQFEFLFSCCPCWASFLLIYPKGESLIRLVKSICSFVAIWSFFRSGEILGIGGVSLFWFESSNRSQMHGLWIDCCTPYLHAFAPPDLEIWDVTKTLRWLNLLGIAIVIDPWEEHLIFCLGVLW